MMEEGKMILERCFLAEGLESLGNIKNLSLFFIGVFSSSDYAELTEQSSSRITHEFKRNAVKVPLTLRNPMNKSSFIGLYF